MPPNRDATEPDGLMPEGKFQFAFPTKGFAIMHSFAVKAALAAFVLSTSLAGAHAATGAQGAAGAQGSAGAQGAAGKNTPGKPGTQASGKNAASKTAQSVAGSRHTTVGRHTTIGRNVGTPAFLDVENLVSIPGIFDGPLDAFGFQAFRDNTSGDNGKSSSETPEMGYAAPGYFFGAPVYRHAMAQTSATQQTRYHQRLAHVVSELGATSHRITVDSKRGHLTAAEATRARSEERAIRSSAFRTAEAHGGVLPLHDYQRLQADIRNLNRQVHRYATA